MDGDAGEPSFIIHHHGWKVHPHLDPHLPYRSGSEVAEVICDAGDMRGKFAHEAIKQIGAIDENQIAILRLQARRNLRVQACNSRPATADRGGEIRKLAPPGLTLVML